jgi:hypothetical protein
VASTRRARSATGRWWWSSETPVSVSMADWQGNFYGLKLLIRADLGDGVVDNLEVLSEFSNFVNWSKSWIGMVWELQGSKVRYMKLKIESSTEKISGWLTTVNFWLVGHFWARCGHFQELAILELLFPIKLSTTLLKVTHPCKISRLDFLNSQTKAL